MDVYWRIVAAAALVSVSVFTSSSVWAAEDPAAPAETARELVLTFGGDVCLNRNQMKPEPEGALQLEPAPQLAMSVGRQAPGMSAIHCTGSTTSRFASACQPERHHAAEAGHLPSCHLVAGMTL